jgi:hypothetical protein
LQGVSLSCTQRNHNKIVNEGFVFSESHVRDDNLQQLLTNSYMI